MSAEGEMGDYDARALLPARAGKLLQPRPLRSSSHTHSHSRASASAPAPSDSGRVTRDASAHAREPLARTHERARPARGPTPPHPAGPAQPPPPARLEAARDGGAWLMRCVGCARRRGGAAWVARARACPRHRVHASVLLRPHQRRPGNKDRGSRARRVHQPIVSRACAVGRAAAPGPRAPRAAVQRDACSMCQLEITVQRQSESP
jgi:hypothetical protein